MKKWTKPQMWELDAKQTACQTIKKSSGGDPVIPKPPCNPKPPFKWCW